MSEQKDNKRFIAVGLMLFALFFGAGNLIFPASMGQHAGENVWWSVLGFIVTGVGLPLAGVLAIGYSGCKNLQELAGRVHPKFGLLFTVVSYLTIGPFFATPRTGSVSYESKYTSIRLPRSYKSVVPSRFRNDLPTRF